MTTKKMGAFLDSKIAGIDASTLHRTRRSKYRARIRKALADLPNWADDARWMVSRTLRGRLQCRHTATGCWVTVNRLRYTEAVVRNLTLGLWLSVTEHEDTVVYTCLHGNAYIRKFRNTSPPKHAVMFGQCPQCLANVRSPVFGTLTRKRRKWEQGLSDPQSPCVLYVHQLRDGSFIYGVSDVARFSHRMDQYKASMGYKPEVIYRTEGTERHMWYAEEVLKKGITKGLDHACEARGIEGGRTEYLPETYTVQQVVELVEEALEIVA